MSKRGGNRGLVALPALVGGVLVRGRLRDPQYQASVAWRNTAYNPPPHTSFYLGEGMKAPPRPDIRTQ